MQETDELLKEIKSKKYKKDPFGKNYVQHAVSELKVEKSREDDESFKGLATDLKIRSEIINSQLKFLTDKVNQVNKEENVQRDDPKPTKVPVLTPRLQHIDDIVAQKMEILEMISKLSLSELQEYCSANLTTKIPWIDNLAANMPSDRKKAYVSLVTDLKDCDKDGFYAPKETSGIPILEEMSNEVRDYFASQKIEESSNDGSFKEKIVPYLKLVEPFAFEDISDELMQEEEEVAVEQMRYYDSTDTEDELPREPSKPVASARVQVKASTSASTSAKVSGLQLTQQNKKRKDSPKAVTSTKDTASHSGSKAKERSLPTLDELRRNHQRMQQELSVIRSKKKKESVICVANWCENNATDFPTNRKDSSADVSSLYNVYHARTASFGQLNIGGEDSELNRYVMAFPATIAVPKHNHMKIDTCNSIFFGIKACLHCWFARLNVLMETDKVDGSDDIEVSNLPIEQLQFDNFFERNSSENGDAMVDDDQADYAVDDESPPQHVVDADTTIAVGDNLFYPNAMELEESVIEDTPVKKSESRRLTRLSLGTTIKESTVLRTKATLTPSITVSMLQNLIKKRLSNRRKTTMDLTKVADDAVVDEGNETELEKLSKRTFISTILLADEFNRHSKNNQMSLEPAGGSAIDVTINDNE